jgi:flagellar basal-body rod protein FlgB
MNDTTVVALQSMLRGLSARQRVISDNLANLETPGFTAHKVQFEGALSAALEAGESPDVNPTIVASGDPYLPNGNNVSVDQEIINLQDTGLAYDLAVEAINAKFTLLRTSMKSTI